MRCGLASAVATGLVRRAQPAKLDAANHQTTSRKGYRLRHRPPSSCPRSSLQKASRRSATCVPTHRASPSAAPPAAEPAPLAREQVRAGRVRGFPNAKKQLTLPTRTPSGFVRGQCFGSGNTLRCLAWLLPAGCTSPICRMWDAGRWRRTIEMSREEGARRGLRRTRSTVAGPAVDAGASSQSMQAHQYTQRCAIQRVHLRKQFGFVLGGPSVTPHYRTLISTIRARRDL